MPNTYLHHVNHKAKAKTSPAPVTIPDDRGFFNYIDPTLNIKARIKQAQYIAILCFLLLLTYLIYIPGLNSGYFLDDPSNLQALSNITEFDLKNIALYSLSGFSGPSGRPLSLLTFAFQYENWPDNPSAFKFVNLMIHLINTVLVFIISKQLFHFHKDTRSRCFELALFTATTWAIHPIQVSTVLYSIQRMTELSATFMLLGIMFYLYGRKLLSNELKIKTAYLWMSFGLIVGTLLSVLSKENGILIFLFVLVIEKTLLDSSQPQRLLKHWQLIFITLPIVIIFAYLFYKFDADSNFQHRNFTLAERLTTENAIIFDYLKKIVLPTINSFSLYYDDFPISKNLTDSYQTLVGFLLISSSLFFSIVYRKRFPLICFGFLWFYSGHVLESTFLALELYFEHRNYVPLLGIVFIIVSLFYHLLNRIKSKIITITLYIFVVLYTTYLAFVTIEQTKLWGDRHQAKLTWALEKPNSTRAQSAAANVMAYKGNYEQAVLFTQKIIKATPNDPSPYIAWLHYRCNTESIPLPDMEKLFHLAEHGTVNQSSIFILNNIVLDEGDGKCKKITYQEISTLFSSFEKNKNLIKHADFFQIYSMFEGNQGHYIKALNLANRSLTYKQDVKVALFQLRWLSLLGDYQAAYNYLDKVKEINNSLPKTSILHSSSIKEWEDFLLKQLPSKP